MIAAICTSPLDIIKTRLQSEHHLYRSPAFSGLSSYGIRLFPAYHLFLNIYHIEGGSGFFKGLGPNLIGVVPARAIHFYTYENTKKIFIKYFNNNESSWIHLMSAISAGIVTSTITNPIWMIKTRLQLDKAAVKTYRNTWDCVRKTIQKEGFYSLYRGMSASYLGVSESTIQWVLYERFKKRFAEKQKPSTWLDPLVAAGTAKLIATILTYPHEVVRTRLRQYPAQNGHVKYKGLMQCFCLICREEGISALYGGLAIHLLRVIPNAAIMFGSYELIMSLFL
ncbi:hypothetical protein T552_02834 [Pneumocystis carinii B80]|uniref:Mitochondrial carrier protein n=1 Tax=Pneumocystis carinii (strain B80) TaxID=1408658 RepID=A0A0W4ZD88_PNEC8|nr:hypothetical protein T552_02834 [Pneumocystis carinii B80]KTW26351.1 hypothetical protein T552_02834 [Pneumocystis carinii B80]